MQRASLKTLALLAALVAVPGGLAGCADSIRPDPSSRPDAFLVDSSIDGVSSMGAVTTKQWPDGTYATLVDATSQTEWTHVDFETRAEVPATGPWDLRFQRSHISTNGGVTGTGGVEVAPIPARSLAEVTAAPATGWITDAPDGGDDDMLPDYAFEQGDGWYEYNAEKHTLKPRPLVWVVKTAGGGTFKLALERYYDAAGTPAWFTFHWATL
jgi:hypothetical protein